MRVLLALVVAVVVAVFAPPPVEACSGIGPGYYPVALEDGAVLPTNAVIAMRWKRFPGGSDQLAPLYLADESGEEVALVAERLPWERPDVEALRLRPVAELAPGTRYELRRPAIDEGDYWVLAWFVTGDGPDVEAPSAPSVGRVIVQPFADSEPEDCGGEYLVRHVDVYLDGERPATYVVREGERVVATDSATPVRVVANCDRRDRDTETYQDEFELEPGAHALSISAVDFAGNESAPVAAEIEIACPEPALGGCRASGHGWAGWGAGLVVLVLSARPRRVVRSGRRGWGGRGCRLPTAGR